MKNKLEDLRNHLFETLEALKDRDVPMDVARAKAISDVAQTIINSAKVEVQFLEATGEAGAGQFFGGKRLERMPAGASVPRALTALGHTQQDEE